MLQSLPFLPMPYLTQNSKKFNFNFACFQTVSLQHTSRQRSSSPSNTFTLSSTKSTSSSNIVDFISNTFSKLVLAITNTNSTATDGVLLRLLLREKRFQHCRFCPRNWQISPNFRNDSRTYVSPVCAFGFLGCIF